MWNLADGTWRILQNMWGQPIVFERWFHTCWCWYLCWAKINSWYYRGKFPLLLGTGVFIALLHGPCQVPGVRMLFPHYMGTRFWSGRSVWFAWVAYHKLWASWRDIHHRRRFQCKYWNTTSGGWFLCIWSQWDWKPEWQGRFANAMDNATWTAHTKQAGQYTGSGRGLDVPSSDGFEFDPTWLHFDLPKIFNWKIMVWFLYPDWFRSSMCSLSIEITVAQTEKNERKFWASKIGGPTWMKTTSLQTFNQKFDHCLRQTVRQTWKFWKTCWFKLAFIMERC